MSLGKLQRAWGGVQLLDELILIYPTYAIMMQEQGLSATQLSILFAIWSGSSIVFEVPSGVVGDLVRRKNLVAVGSIIKAFAFAAWLLFPSFWGFAIGFALWSLGDSARSGTAQALLHDGLAQLGEAEQFEKVYGRIEAWEGVGIVIAVGLGGLAAEGGYTLPLVLSCMAPLLSAGAMLALIPEPPRTHEDEDAGFSTTLSAGLRAMVTSRTIAVLVAMFSLLVVPPGILEEYVGPMLEEDGLSLTMVGVVGALMWGARTVGVLLAHRLRTPDLPRLAVLFGLGHAVLLLLVLPGAAVTVAALSGYYLIVGAAEVLQQGALQRSISSHARATITSLAGMAAEVVSIALFLTVGILADWQSWSAAFVLVAGGTVAAAGVFTLLARGIVISGGEE